MSIQAKEIKITDSVGQRATDCVVSMAATGNYTPPTVEFGFPGDTQQLVTSNLRPTGATLSIRAGFYGVPLHECFTGLIEYMDDLEDANRSVWDIKLSAMPKDHPHRVKVTRVFNSYFTDNAEATHSTDILSAICKDVNLLIGRSDMPDYVIVGTYDVLHQSPVEVAEALVAPFNLFDFQKYYVRTDAHGLQIIKIDFTQPAGGGVYEIPNVISYERSYEAYMPESRVGPGNVILTGGDIIVFESQGTFQRTVTQTFTTSTKDSQDIASFDKWVERTTKVEFVCTLTGADVAAGSLEQLVTALKNGDISDLKINESFTTSDESFEYDSVNGLLRSTHTYYTYEDKTFSTNTYLSLSVTKKVLVKDETQEFLYPGGKQFPKSLSRRLYGFNDIGVQTTTQTYEYFGFRGTWVLNTTKIEQGDAIGATNAEIQFYASGKKSINNPTLAGITNPGVIKSTKTQIGKYQLYNGAELPILSKDLLNHPFDPGANFALAAFQRQTAYQLSGPNMNYDGLQLLWSLVQTQRSLEQANAYWETVKVVASLDTTPQIGSSVKVAGVYGFVVDYNHDIDDNKALTSVTVKRLVRGNA